MAAAIRYGQVGTWNQLVGVPIDIDEAVVMLPTWDVPLQTRIESAPATQITVEWLEEDLTPSTVTVDSVSGTDTPWDVTLTAGQGDLIRVGDVLQNRRLAPGKQYLVTAVATDVITVASFGTTVGTVSGDDPAAADVLEIIGQYRNEGADPEDARSVDRVQPFNYTQWGQEKVEVTRTDRKRTYYGLDDPYDREVEKKFKELAVRFERSMVNGVRTISNDNKRRFMGGLFYFITTNTVSGVKANIETLINDLLRKCYDQGGTPKTLMVSTAIKPIISSTVNANLRRTTRDDRGGGSVVDSYLSDFGEIIILMNRHFPMTKGVLLQEEFIKRRPFDPYFHEMLAKTGDAEKGQIVGEQSLEVKNERAHGTLTVTDAT